MILENYFKHDFVKDIFMKSCLFINDIEQVELLVKILSTSYTAYNIIFSKSYLKAIFFSKIKIYYPDINIINCDSSKSRLLNEISHNNNLIIFDKINYCYDIEIFNRINNINNKILIC